MGDPLGGASMLGGGKGGGSAGADMSGLSGGLDAGSMFGGGSDLTGGMATGSDVFSNPLDAMAAGFDPTGSMGASEAITGSPTGQGVTGTQDLGGTQAGAETTGQGPSAEARAAEQPPQQQPPTPPTTAEAFTPGTAPTVAGPTGFAEQNVGKGDLQQFAPQAGKSDLQMLADQPTANEVVGARFGGPQPPVSVPPDIIQAANAADAFPPGTQAADFPGGDTKTAADVPPADTSRTPAAGGGGGGGAGTVPGGVRPGTTGMPGGMPGGMPLGRIVQDIMGLMRGNPMSLMSLVQDLMGMANPAAAAAGMRGGFPGMPGMPFPGPQPFAGLPPNRYQVPPTSAPTTAPASAPPPEQPPSGTPAEAEYLSNPPRFGPAETAPGQAPVYGQPGVRFNDPNWRPEQSQLAPGQPPEGTPNQPQGKVASLEPGGGVQAPPPGGVQAPPPGVGVASQPLTRNEISTPRWAPAGQPSMRPSQPSVDRSKFKNENNEATITRAAWMVNGEIGLNRPVREQLIMLETAGNRALKQNISLGRALQDTRTGGYYDGNPAHPTYSTRSRPSADQVAAFKTNVWEPFMRGSNLSDVGWGPMDGNASAGLAQRQYARGQQGYTLPNGETIFREIRRTASLPAMPQAQAQPPSQPITGIGSLFRTQPQLADYRDFQG